MGAEGARGTWLLGPQDRPQSSGRRGLSPHLGCLRFRGASAAPALFSCAVHSPARPLAPTEKSRDSNSLTPRPGSQSTWGSGSVSQELGGPPRWDPGAGDLGGCGAEIQGDQHVQRRVCTQLLSQTWAAVTFPQAPAAASEWGHHDCAHPGALVPRLASGASASGCRGLPPSLGGGCWVQGTPSVWSRGSQGLAKGPASGVLPGLGGAPRASPLLSWVTLSR